MSDFVEALSLLYGVVVIACGIVRWSHQPSKRAPLLYAFGIAAIVIRWYNDAFKSAGNLLLLFISSHVDMTLAGPVLPSQ
jgi:hypothetical protein